MTAKQRYARKLLSPEEAAAKVHSGDTVVVAMAASEPPGLLQALSARRELRSVRLVSCLLLRDYGFLTNSESFLLESWFFGPMERQAFAHGHVSYIPNNLHEAGVKKVEKDTITAFFGTAAPMDEHGLFSLSLGVTYEQTVLEAADLVILEINENMPRTLGDTQVHIDQVDWVVENTTDLVQLPPAKTSAADETIGTLIAAMVQDGSTLQLGIGGIPNAITRHLQDKHDLGIHTEMFTDGMVDLYEAGVITGRRKSLWPRKMVGTFALGTDKLYRFLHHNLAVEFQQGKVTNDPYIIGQNYRMVSVNTALEVDLSGQVTAEWLHGRQFSGTGGQVDTHRGAQRSPGGRGIIALRATAKGGSVSTIKAQLAAGAKITLGRNDVDTVVTEYGAAELKAVSVKERVRRLIAIAHPDFREQLSAEAKALHLI